MTQPCFLPSPPQVTLATIAALLAAALAAPAQAQVVNGDFSAGLSGWDTAGDASVGIARGADPTRLWLATASTAYADDIDYGFGTAGARKLSGNAAVEVGPGTPAALEGFTGVGPGAFDPVPGVVAAYEGSAAKQSYNAAAGSTLQFRWDFGTLDPRADTAFVVIDGQVTTLASSIDATLPGTDGNAARTGWTNFGYTFANAGLHTISFGVVHVGDYDATSTLAIAGVNVSAVPEAPPLVLVMAGLALPGFKSRRRS